VPRRALLSPPASGSVLKLKVWLLDISPMVWRRVLVPASCTLRELHGVIQAAMGWEGIHLYQFHLRAVRYGSFELSASSPDVAIDKLGLRKGARFVYEYDLNAVWRHEIRIEGRLDPDPRKAYPACLDGNGACPPEDCGGPADYLERRDDVLSLDAFFDDLDAIADFVEQTVFEQRREVLFDTERVGRIELARERIAERKRWQGRPFSRREVNARFRCSEHHVFKQQQ
jgi:hypothetical protein